MPRWTRGIWSRQYSFRWGGGVEVPAEAVACRAIMAPRARGSVRAIFGKGFIGTTREGARERYRFRMETAICAHPLSARFLKVPLKPVVDVLEDGRLAALDAGEGGDQ